MDDTTNDMIKRQIKNEYIKNSKLIEALFGPEVTPEEGFEERTAHLIAKTLTTRQALTLIYRFGLSDGKILTLKEVGKKFDVLPGRISEIKTRALRILRHPSRSDVILHKPKPIIAEEAPSKE